MGFKMGALVGFAAGYYFGAKAGRERYEQINSWIDQVRSNESIQQAQQKAREIIDDAEDVAANYSQN